MKEEATVRNKINTQEIAHIYCGTPECCGNCDTAERKHKVKVRLNHRLISLAQVIKSIYQYFKGICVYLKYGLPTKRQLRKPAINNRK